MAPRGWGALVVAALVAAGCGSTSTYRVMLGMPGPAVAARTPVRITRGAALPGFRVTEVALVQAVGRGSHADLPHLAEALEAEALSLGCDAVIRVRHVQGVQQAVAIGVAVRTTPGQDAAPAQGLAPTGWPVGAPAATPEAAPAATPGATGTLTAPWQR
jgi:hypothetical protein